MKMRIAALALLLGATVAVAGEYDKKCTAEIGACLTQMVEGLREKGWLGVELEWGEDKRPVVKRVLAQSPAATAGLEAGDVLAVANGVSFADPEVKKLFKPDAVLALQVERRGKPIRLEAHLVPVPEHILAQWVGEHMLHQHAEQVAEAPAQPAAPAGGPKP